MCDRVYFQLINLLYKNVVRASLGLIILHCWGIGLFDDCIEIDVDRRLSLCSRLSLLGFVVLFFIIFDQLLVFNINVVFFLYERVQDSCRGELYFISDKIILSLYG